ncbi:MAG: hypothetical protein WA294_11925 [Acidobacteriaceae bacterium]
MKSFALPSLVVSILAFALASPCSAQRAELADAPMPAVADLAPNGSTEASAAIMQVPPAAQPPRLHLMDWTLLGMGATLRALDYTSTEKGLEHPQYLHEGMLPFALVHNKPAFAAFEAGTVALNFGAYRLLVRHNMRSLARISQYMYVGVMTGQVARNYQLIGEVPAH